ncbi:myb-like protein D, partial [Aphis craccivora]
IDKNFLDDQKFKFLRNLSKTRKFAINPIKEVIQLNGNSYDNIFNEKITETEILLTLKTLKDDTAAGIAVVAPLFKGGNRAEINNYRPISMITFYMTFTINSSQIPISDLKIHFCENTEKCANTNTCTKIQSSKYQIFRKEILNIIVYVLNPDRATRYRIAFRIYSLR